jgi:hypothetical protein
MEKSAQNSPARSRPGIVSIWVLAYPSPQTAGAWAHGDHSRTPIAPVVADSNGSSKESFRPTAGVREWRLWGTATDWQPRQMQNGTSDGNRIAIKANETVTLRARACTPHRGSLSEPGATMNTPRLTIESIASNMKSAAWFQTKVEHKVQHAFLASLKIVEGVLAHMHYGPLNSRVSDSEWNTVSEAMTATVKRK